jgi:hypothetical protein
METLVEMASSTPPMPVGNCLCAEIVTLPDSSDYRARYYDPNIGRFVTELAPRTESYDIKIS